MTDSVFDVALEKRFTDSAEIALIDVTSADLMLIRNNETGAVMRIPISTLASAMNAALTGSAIISKLGYTPENVANKGTANGYAELDSSGKVPSAQLPSFVDDVLEYANLASFPGTGETGKIYVALDTNKTYRWSGSAYVEISASLALGETSSTAYRGDRGKTAYDHSQVTGNPHSTSKSDVGLGNVDNTSDANKPVSTAQATAIAAKADVAQAAWTAATLLNGWQNLGSGYETVQYMKDTTGVVFVKGNAKSGSGIIFNLPSGYRPSATRLLVTSGDALHAEILISTAGDVSIHAGTASVYITLEFSFRV